MSNIVTYKEILGLKSNLAPSQLKILDIPNKNNIPLKELLFRELTFKDKGNEVGSINYIRKSTHFFIRAKSLQSNSYLPYWNNETILPIRPQVFKNYNLKKGDIIISKDSNIGEIIILDKDYPNHTISGALYKLPLERYKYYILAFIKHDYFREQLDLLVPKGSTIRHAKTLFLDCKVPFPNGSNKDMIIQYVEVLIESIINKEIEIRKKSQMIFNLIKDELLCNQLNNKFSYSHPSKKEIIKLMRMDAGIYSEKFKKEEFIIKNYIYGTNSVYDLGFDVSRGQNLQVSCIGKSIYSDIYKKDFYKLIKPMHISSYGTIMGNEFLGNSRKLKTLKAGDIIFGAEGFEKGRSLVILKDEDKTITNIHGITLNHKQKNITLSIFVKCFLDYLRKIEMVDLYAVGGNGGSLAMKYWNVIPIPNFPSSKQKEIGILYHNPMKIPKNLNLNNFLSKMNEFDNQSGIIELDNLIKKLQNQLNLVLNSIIKDEEIKINFNFF